FGNVVCQYCDDGYTNLGNMCIQCPKEFRMLFTISMVTIFQLLWVFINKFAASNFDTIDIMLISAQVLSMITQFNLSWHTEYLSLYLWSAIQFMDFDVDFFNITCSIDFNLVKYSPLLQLTLPIVVLLFQLPRCILSYLSVVLHRMHSKLPATPEEEEARLRNPILLLMKMAYSVHDHTAVNERQMAHTVDGRLRGLTCESRKSKDFSREVSVGKRLNHVWRTHSSKVEAISELLVDVAYVLCRWMKMPTNEVDGLHYVEDSINFYTNFLNIVYHTLCIKTFTIFQCQTLADGSGVMVASPDITCWEGVHLVYMFAGFCSIQLYVLGIPLLFGSILRYGIAENVLNSTNFLRRYGWLYLRYESPCIAWELTFLVRRCAFAMILTCFRSYPGVQIVSGIMVLCLLLSAHYYKKPFLDDRLDTIESISIFSNIFVLLFGSIFYQDSLLDHPDLSNYFVPITFIFIVCMMVAFFFLVSSEMWEHHGKTKAKKLVETELQKMEISFEEMPFSDSLKGSALIKWADILMEDRKIDASEQLQLRAYEHLNRLLKDYVEDDSQYSYFSGSQDAKFHERVMLAMPFMMDWLANCTEKEHEAFAFVCSSFKTAVKINGWQGIYGEAIVTQDMGPLGAFLLESSKPARALFAHVMDGVTELPDSKRSSNHDVIARLLDELDTEMEKEASVIRQEALRGQKVSVEESTVGRNGGGVCANEDGGDEAARNGEEDSGGPVQTSAESSAFSRAEWLRHRQEGMRMIAVLQTQMAMWDKRDTEAPLRPDECEGSAASVPSNDEGGGRSTEFHFSDEDESSRASEAESCEDAEASSSPPLRLSESPPEPRVAKLELLQKSPVRGHPLRGHPLSSPMTYDRLSQPIKVMDIRCPDSAM
ncbi:hypothetical protein CYMTET_14852, partial [Cymbomonas tetramitiformis]